MQKYFVAIEGKKQGVLTFWLQLELRSGKKVAYV